MFIEKVKKEDLEEFAKRYDCSISGYNAYEFEGLITLFTGYFGPQPELYVTDFTCRANSYYSKYNAKFEKDWRKFLYSKFGEEYKTELKKYFEKKVDELGM